MMHAQELHELASDQEVSNVSISKIQCLKPWKLEKFSEIFQVWTFYSII